MVANGLQRNIHVLSNSELFLVLYYYFAQLDIFVELDGPRGALVTSMRWTKTHVILSTRYVNPHSSKTTTLPRALLQVGREGHLIEPINYEEWIDGKTTVLRECDPHTDLMLFPSDDIEVL